jgi:hypothetical protein
LATRRRVFSVALTPQFKDKRPDAGGNRPFFSRLVLYEF